MSPLKIVSPCSFTTSDNVPPVDETENLLLAVTPVPTDKAPVLTLEYVPIETFPSVVELLVVEKNENSLEDSSHIKACVAPLPRFINNPESNDGVAD